jgi:hypothetical protein
MTFGAGAYGLIDNCSVELFAIDSDGSSCISEIGVLDE